MSSFSGSLTVSCTCNALVIYSRHLVFWQGLQYKPPSAPEIHFTLRAADNPEHPSDGHSERKACITFTRAARAAGSTDAITATAISTNAETNTGKAPGILTSGKYLPAKRVSIHPNAAPARRPSAAIVVPSAITPLSSRCGADPRASRMPNSRVRELTEKASTPATPT